MTEQEKSELKIATYLVGFFFFLCVWWIWNALDVSVFAVQAASPELSATGFSLGVLGTEILGPAILTILFVMSKAGDLILKFAARLVARFNREEAISVDTSKFASVAKVGAELKKLSDRIKSLESTVSRWESSDV